MKRDDKQLGNPEFVYKDTQANINLITGSGYEGEIGYATDIGRFGYCIGNSWAWEYRKELIYDNTLAVTGSWNITNLGGFDHLEYIIKTRPSGTTTRDIYLAINGDANNANYETQQHYGGDAHGYNMAAERIAGWNPYNSAETSLWNMIEGQIFFASMTDSWKIFRSISHSAGSATTGLEVLRSTRWKNTAAITRLTFISTGDALAAGSRIQLFGWR